MGRASVEAEESADVKALLVRGMLVKANANPQLGYFLVVTTWMVAVSRVVSPGSFGPDMVVCFGADGHVALEVRHTSCVKEGGCGDENGCSRGSTSTGRADGAAFAADHRAHHDLCRDVSLPSAPSSVASGSDGLAKKIERMSPASQRGSGSIIEPLAASGTRRKKPRAKLGGFLPTRGHPTSTGLSAPHRVIWLL